LQSIYILLNMGVKIKLTPQAFTDGFLTGVGGLGKPIKPQPYPV